MSIWTRIANVFRGERLNREIEEELEAHVADALADGRDAEEARRALGSALRLREQSRDLLLIPWLDSIRADAVLGWRQLMKRKVTSLSAILSLGLAIGACTAAFRLVDALLLRPLPVSQPEQLYSLVRAGSGFDGKPRIFDGWAYPDFQLMQAASKGEAELLAFSYVERVDLTFSTDQEMEKAHVQYVSGGMFPSFGLTPAAGRLLSEADDKTPGGHPYAVLSYDYWKQRFGADRRVVGRNLRIGETMYEVVGIANPPFTGTEPGTVTDVFLPAMMHTRATREDSTWHRTLARIRPGVEIEPLRAKLDATSRAFEENRARGFTGISRQKAKMFLEQRLLMQPAASGTSDMQKEYQRALGALAVLVLLVLLIACANVANLMSAQAAARSREMALRVSIGAGRGRLVQLVLVESSMLAFLAAAAGGLFASWAAPFVVGRINPPDNPAQLSMPADWRVFAFSLVLTLLVTCLFGLVPALRASGVKPASALKGGDDPHSRRRLMHALIAVQVAFCFLVLFVSGLFVTTVQHLSNRPLGFSAERLLALDTVASQGQSPEHWDQVVEQLRQLPGVESATVCARPLLGGSAWNNFVSVNGGPPGPVLAYFLAVSPGWMDTMKIPFSAGADFRPGSTSPGVAIVNETFVKQFYPGENPLGKIFLRGAARYEVVGVVKDAPYRSLREEMLPVAFVPMRQLTGTGEESPIRGASFLVKTHGADPLALAAALRTEIPRLNSGLRVSNLRTQEELVQAQTVRERLLAMLALFFAAVALLLAGIGLYGVLDYSVLQRRREIGIRMAVGARGTDIARGVTADSLAMVLLGSGAGMAIGLASARSLESLLYGVKSSDPGMLALPWLVIVVAALVAAVPAVVRAVRINPVTSLRME